MVAAAEATAAAKKKKQNESIKPSSRLFAGVRRSGGATDAPLAGPRPSRRPGRHCWPLFGASSAHFGPARGDT